MDILQTKSHCRRFPPLYRYRGDNNGAVMVASYKVFKRRWRKVIKGWPERSTGHEAMAWPTSPEVLAAVDMADWLADWHSTGWPEDWPTRMEAASELFDIRLLRHPSRLPSQILEHFDAALLTLRL